MTDPPTTVQLLEFDRRFPKHTGLKTQAIQQELGLTVGHYYQLLLTALDTREALEHDGLLVHAIRSRIHDASRLRLRLIRRRPR